MEQKAMMEARVWARVTGQKLENCGEKEEISGFLEQEYSNLAFYRSLCKCLPRHRELTGRLVCLAEDTIKYLKTMYFVETGRCYKEKCLENPCICSVCEALRDRYQRVQKGRETYEKGSDKWEKPAHNKALEVRFLVCLLQRVL